MKEGRSSEPSMLGRGVVEKTSAKEVSDPVGVAVDLATTRGRPDPVPTADAPILGHDEADPYQARLTR